MSAEVAERTSWDRAVSTGSFATAVIGLILALAASWVQINVQRAEDHARIESLSIQVTRQQGVLDNMQIQQTATLVEVSKVNGKVDTLITQLSSVDAGGRGSRK